MSANNSTSFAIGGFWYHLSLVSGTIYKDQHNFTWIKKDDTFISQCGGLQYKPEIKPKRLVSAKDLFLQQRESYHEYFHSKTALINR